MLEDNLDIEAYLARTGKDDLRRFNYLKDALIGKKVLDFRCGAGGFLYHAGNTAKTAQGVELNKYLYESIIIKGNDKVK